MQINDVKAIIIKRLRAKGVPYDDRLSLTSSSVYFTIYSGSTSLMFRISDHSTKASIITLRTDKKLTTESVIRFVDNRCHDLSYRHVKDILGISTH